MIPHLVIGAASFLAASLTLYSGFGLGTLLMPVYALFFPVPVAVAATAVVHAANSVFKVLAVGKLADRAVVLRFGGPAVLAALAGAAALDRISHFAPLCRWRSGPISGVITPVKATVAVLIFAFALLELVPALREIGFSRRYLPLGGLLSGFFGGLSGHQGALRSAFLIKSGLTKEVFVGTGAVIGFLVDVARIGVYALFLPRGGPVSEAFSGGRWGLVVTGIAAAFAGVNLSSRHLEKVTISTVRTLVGILLVLVALGLGAGAL